MFKGEHLQNEDEVLSFSLQSNSAGTAKKLSKSCLCRSLKAVLRMG